MQAYDILMLVVLASATLFGMIKGFAWQIASLASIFISYVVAYKFRGQLADRIQAEAPWNQFLAMLLLYGGSSFAIWVVFRLISGSIDRVRLRDFDRQMGALFGFGKGVLYCLLITLFAVTLLGQRQQQAIVQSKSGHYISTILTAAEGVALPRELEGIIRPHLDRAKQRLDGGATATASNEIAPGGFRPGDLGLPSTSPGQGGYGGIAPPNGLPVSIPGVDPATLGGVFDAARAAIQNGYTPQGGYPAENGYTGAQQGGWSGNPAGAPLPQSGSGAPSGYGVFPPQGFPPQQQPYGQTQQPYGQTQQPLTPPPLPDWSQLYGDQNGQRPY